MKKFFGRGLVICWMVLLAIHAGGAYANDFSAGPNMPGNRFGPNVAPLPDGRVLVAGGYDGASRLATAWLFDPSNGSFAVTASMGTARQQSATAPIAGGRILVAGGLNNGGARVATAEIFDATSATFTAVAATMSVARQGPAAAVLADGRVLIIGGFSGSSYQTSVEIFDPTTQTFSATGSLNSARAFAAAARLADGRVLVAGGVAGSGALNSAEIYNPATGQFSALPVTMAVRRGGAFAVPLADGKVVIGGGDDSSSTYRSDAEVYDPATGTFASFASTLPGGRAYGSASLLQDGRAIVFGGASVFNGTPLNTTAYLFRPAAPTLTATPASVVAGTNLTWTATTRNGDSVNLQDVTLSLPLPAATQFVSAAASAGGACSTPAVGATGTVLCTWSGATAPTVTRSVDVVAQVPSSASGALTATVSANAVSYSTPLSASATTPITTSATLQPGLTATPTPVVAGSNVSWAASARNTGPSDAQGVVLSLPLPPATGFVSATASTGGSCAAPAVGATGTVLCVWSGATAPAVTRSIDVVAQVLPSATGTLAVTYRPVRPPARRR